MRNRNGVRKEKEKKMELAFVGSNIQFLKREIKESEQKTKIKWESKGIITRRRLKGLQQKPKITQRSL